MMLQHNWGPWIHPDAQDLLSAIVHIHIMYRIHVHAVWKVYCWSVHIFTRADHRKKGKVRELVKSGICQPKWGLVSSFLTF